MAALRLVVLALALLRAEVGSGAGERPARRGWGRSRGAGAAGRRHWRWGSLDPGGPGARGDPGAGRPLDEGTFRPPLGAGGPPPPKPRAGRARPRGRRRAPRDSRAAPVKPVRPGAAPAQARGSPLASALLSSRGRAAVPLRPVGSPDLEGIVILGRI